MICALVNLWKFVRRPTAIRATSGAFYIAKKDPQGKFHRKARVYLAGNETAVWVELQLGHPHDPSNPVKKLSP
jgi:hypothetical protein